MAQAQNHPEVGGQLNQCWGQVASQLAQLDGATGGGMGNHSRSTTAVNNVGGFADGSPITLNGLNDGNHGRQGVGNVSAGPPHNTAPGDGGNGVHAINNALATARLDPVTGDFRPAGSEPMLSCP
jgi:hypothetical protein